MLDSVSVASIACKRRLLMSNSPVSYHTTALHSTSQQFFGLPLIRHAFKMPNLLKFCVGGPLFLLFVVCSLNLFVSDVNGRRTHASCLERLSEFFSFEHADCVIRAAHMWRGCVIRRSLMSSPPELIKTKQSHI